MRKANYRYKIDFKFRQTGEQASFLTGYIPSGLKTSEIRRYIQGQATDKKITKVSILTQRQYYPEIEPVGPNGEIDINDAELYAVQAEITKKNAEAIQEEEKDDVES